MTAASGVDREPFIKRFERENPEAMTRARAEVAAAASGADQPTLRDQLAETVHVALKRLEEGDLPHEVAVSTDDGVLYWDELDTSEYLGLVLLPLIEADRERAKVEGGAEALEQAAADFDLHGLLFDAPVPDLLRHRAAALRGSTGGAA